jgi:flagellar biosynthesis/type III secretory pathway M-ring protein FliF/YscJ
VILLLIAALAISKMRNLATGGSSASGMAMLRPGARVGELEAMMGGDVALPPMRATAAIAPGQVDPNVGVRDRARELARDDPARAAHLLKAWINTDNEQRS